MKLKSQSINLIGMLMLASSLGFSSTAAIPLKTANTTLKALTNSPQENPLITLITQKISPGLYKGVSMKGESCAVSVEMQARFWNNHPAISVLVMNEKALGPQGKVIQMNALSRFVFAENHELFKNTKKTQLDSTLEIQVDKKSLALNEAPSHMGLKIENVHQGLLIETQESTQNFFNKTKKVNCYIE